MLDLDTIKNSLGMWLACAPMVIVLLVQSFLFFRMARKEAVNLEIPDDVVKKGVRSAAMTAIGPTVATVIALFTLMSVFGTPVSWTKMCDIGAGRTELSMSIIAQAQAPTEGANVEQLKFAYGLWGMAILSVGWVLFTMLFINRMDAIVAGMNKRFNPEWVKTFMGCTMITMFSYTLASQLIGKNVFYYIAAITSGGSMLLLKKFVKRQTLKELSLGIAMIIGITVATICQYTFGA